MGIIAMRPTEPVTTSVVLFSGIPSGQMYDNRGGGRALSVMAGGYRSRLALGKDAKKTQFALLDRGLEACYRRYADLSTQWAGLDTKAQGTATVAGIFLAGVFSFVNSLPQSSSVAERLLMTVAILLLGMSILLALLTLRLRHVREVCARDFVSATEDLLGAKDGNPAERTRDFIRDQINLWFTAIDTIKTVVDRKARNLQLAQLMLVLAVVCAGAVVTLKIWGVPYAEELCEIWV